MTGACFGGVLFAGLVYRVVTQPLLCFIDYLAERGRALQGDLAWARVIKVCTAFVICSIYIYTHIHCMVANPKPLRGRGTHLQILCAPIDSLGPWGCVGGYRCRVPFCYLGRYVVKASL